MSKFSTCDEAAPAEPKVLLCRKQKGNKKKLELTQIEIDKGLQKHDCLKPQM